jgi:hypothetical protein
MRTWTTGAGAGAGEEEAGGWVDAVSPSMVGYLR